MYVCDVLITVLAHKFYTIMLNERRSLMHKNAIYRHKIENVFVLVIFSVEQTNHLITVYKSGYLFYCAKMHLLLFYYYSL